MTSAMRDASSVAFVPDDWIRATNPTDGPAFPRCVPRTATATPSRDRRRRERKTRSTPVCIPVFWLGSTAGPSLPVAAPDCPLTHRLANRGLGSAGPEIMTYASWTVQAPEPSLCAWRGRARKTNSGTAWRSTSGHTGSRGNGLRKAWGSRLVSASDISATSSRQRLPLRSTQSRNSPMRWESTANYYYGAHPRSRRKR